MKCIQQVQKLGKHTCQSQSSWWGFKNHRAWLTLKTLSILKHSNDKKNKKNKHILNFILNLNPTCIHSSLCLSMFVWVQCSGFETKYHRGCWLSSFWYCLPSVDVSTAPKSQVSILTSLSLFHLELKTWWSRAKTMKTYHLLKFLQAALYVWFHYAAMCL